LDEFDPCVEESSPYIPNNATRQANLPHEDYRLVAIAPWVSANCTLGYLAAARQDPARAFIFYTPDNGTGPLPPASDEMWNLYDGGQWRSLNRFPVFAVAGQVGNTLMDHLSLYSGNLTDVENGHYLAEMYDIRDYARIYTDIKVGELPFICVRMASLILCCSREGYPAQFMDIHHHCYRNPFGSSCCHFIYYAFDSIQSPPGSQTTSHKRRS
jgi:hypothetical protein